MESIANLDHFDFFEIFFDTTTSCWMIFLTSAKTHSKNSREWHPPASSTILWRIDRNKPTNESKHQGTADQCELTHLPR